MPLELFGTTGVGGAQPLARAAGAGRTSAEAGEGFGAALGRMIDAVEQRTGDANAAITSMLDKSGDVHDAMIALQRAEMTLQLTVQIRNKLVTAYQDIMRMPV